PSGVRPSRRRRRVPGRPHPVGARRGGGGDRRSAGHDEPRRGTGGDRPAPDAAGRRRPTGIVDRPLTRRRPAQAPRRGGSPRSAMPISTPPPRRFFAHVRPPIASTAWRATYGPTPAADRRPAVDAVGRS